MDGLLAGLTSPQMKSRMTAVDDLQVRASDRCPSAVIAAGSPVGGDAPADPPPPPMVTTFAPF